MFWDASDGRKRPHGGRTELVANFHAALAAKDLALGILCYAKNPDDDPRQRIGFEWHMLFVLRLTQEGEDLVGYVEGRVGANAAALDWKFVTPLPVPWAVDDLDPAPDGVADPPKVLGVSGGYLRNDEVRRYVLRRAAGKCEFCGVVSFLKPDGSSYLETHHIIHLARQGPDTVRNVIALCPGHHREAHYGAEAERLEHKFLRNLANSCS